MSQAAQVSSSEIREFREQGILKINFAELIGAEAFDGLVSALGDAEAKANAAAAGQDAGNCQPEMFQRLFYLAPHYAEIDAVVRAPVLGEMAAKLAGVDHVRSWIDETFFKPPGSVPCIWHQDLPHFPMDRRGLMTFWVAIDDITPEMGPVRYLPGSHKLGPLGRAMNSDSRLPFEELIKTYRGLKDRPDEYLYEGDLDEVGEITSFSLRAGEAVIHDGLTLHGSQTNGSDRTRRGWACVYFPADTQYTGMPRLEADGLGLVPFQPFDHPRFPIVA